MIKELCQWQIVLRWQLVALSALLLVPAIYGQGDLLPNPAPAKEPVGTISPVIDLAPLGSPRVTERPPTADNQLFSPTLRISTLRANFGPPLGISVRTTLEPSLKPEFLIGRVSTGQAVLEIAPIETSLTATQGLHRKAGLLSSGNRSARSEYPPVDIDPLSKGIQDVYFDGSSPTAVLSGEGMGQIGITGWSVTGIKGRSERMEYLPTAGYSASVTSEDGLAPYNSMIKQGYFAPDTLSIIRSSRFHSRSSARRNARTDKKFSATTQHKLIVKKIESNSSFH